MDTEHASGIVSSSTSIPASSAAAAATSSNNPTHALKRGERAYYTGRAQLYRRDHMQIVQPVKNGIVQDWDAVEQVWQYALNQHLHVDVRDHPLMLSEPTFTSNSDREKMVQMMFEKFDAPAIFLCKSSVLTAFSAGRSTACVVESGAGHTTVSPIHDGYVVTKGVRRSQMGGQKLDELLEKTLLQQEPNRTLAPAYLFNRKVDNDGQLMITPCSYPLTHPSYHSFMLNELLRDMKETLCRLGESAFDSSQKFPTVAYELPDGNMIEIGNERFTVPEHIFNPKYSGLLDVRQEERQNKKGNEQGPYSKVDWIISISTDFVDFVFLFFFLLLLLACPVEA